MKIPCEVVSNQVLPIVRRELTKDLVLNHGLSQSQTAEILGVTDAAVSQYLKKKRGDNGCIEALPMYPDFLSRVHEVSSRIVNGDSVNIAQDICALCYYVKRIGMLEAIYSDCLGMKVPNCAKPANER